MKQVSVPGSKFILSLEDEDNQWFLRLRINNAIEEEVPLTHLEKKTLKTNIKELIEAAHLALNDLQIDMLQKDIWAFIETKLNRNNNKNRQFGTIEDPRYEELINRIERLTTSIEKLEKKISDKEILLT